MGAVAFRWEDGVLLAVFFLVVALVLWAPVVRLPLEPQPEEGSSEDRSGAKRRRCRRLTDHALFRLLFLQHPLWEDTAAGEDGDHSCKLLGGRGWETAP